MLRPKLALNFVRFASQAPKPRITLDQLGLVTDLYVPPLRSSLPSWFTSPRLRWKALKRRMQTFGMNTYMAIKLRKELGRQRFHPLEWKETALLLYSRMNEAFITCDQTALQRVTSRWAYAPLVERAKKLPKDFVYSWKLVRYTSRPKVISLIPLSGGDNAPTQYVQAVYRIESVQQVSKLKHGEDKAHRVEREVCDNIAFVFDTLKTPVQGRLIGSLFETPVEAPMPNAMGAPTARAEMMRDMTVRGDVFRSPPKYLVKKI